MQADPLKLVDTEGDDMHPAAPAKAGAVLSSVYAGLVNLLAGISCALVAMMLVATTAEVVSRAAGVSSSQWMLAVNEYSLLFVAALSAPWLVRNHAMVQVDGFVKMLPRPLYVLVTKLVQLLSAAVCLLFAWLSYGLTIDAAERGAQAIGAMVIPAWVTYATLPLGFSLMGVEFLRFFFGLAAADEDKTSFEGGH